MVSIPSSQIKNILYIPPIKPNPKTTTQYNAKLVIREAENEGYFNVLSAKYLNERFNIQENPADDSSEDDSVDQLRFIKCINLHHENIQKLTCLNYCRNIVYLNLSKNFISDFTALKLCNKLICLDLSSNLIQMLPDFTFWSQMVNLKILYLHDNPIANPDLVMGLFSCPNVIVLSLWDNPIALRDKYRHYIVNSLWPLKILDKHFVSDEEIIEDADFCNSQLRSMSTKLKVDSYLSYGNEDLKNIEKGLQRFLIKINTLESHLSPVLIIQKIIRGYLIRKRLGLIKQKSGMTNMKLPPIQKSSEQIERMVTEHEMDHEDQTKYLKIDLIHLNKISTLENLDREANIRNLLSSFPIDTNRSVHKLDQDKCSSEYISRALDTEQVPGNRLPFYQTDSEEKVSFRFKGVKPPTMSKGSFSELQMEKKRSRCFIKEFDKIYHQNLMSQKPDIKSRPVQKHNSNQLFRKSQGCMGLFLLYKWDKTDRELQEIDKYHEKINLVRMIKNDKMLNSLKTEEDRMRKLTDVKSQHIEHKNNVEKWVENEKENKIRMAEELKMKKMETCEKRSKIKNEIGFSQDFRSKQTAACRAVNNFEQMTFQQDQLQINKNVIAQARKKIKLEMETVKGYLENQSLSRRAENRLEESALDLQILHQTNNRLNDAKMRVERLKAIRRQVSCPRIPVIQLNM